MASTPQPADRAEWLAARKRGIGASDAPAAIGASPWKSPYALWAEKTGAVEPDDLSDKEFVRWGNLLEPAIRDETARRLRCDIHHDGEFYIRQSSRHPHMLCTLDGELWSAGDGVKSLFAEHGVERPVGAGTVQIKTTGAYSAKDWDGDWPLYYRVQTQHELVVTGYRWGVLAVLIGGQELRLFPFARHERFCEALTQSVAEFWRRVVERDPPPADGSAATAAALAKLYPEDDGEEVALPQEALDWAGQLAEAKAAVKLASAIQRDAENKLKAAIGEASYGRLPDGSRFSWKRQTRAEHVVKASTFRVLRACK